MFGRYGDVHFPAVMPSFGGSYCNCALMFLYLALRLAWGINVDDLHRFEAKSNSAIVAREHMWSKKHRICYLTSHSGLLIATYWSSQACIPILSVLEGVLVVLA